MPKFELLSYAQVLEKSAGLRHLLLGNGFSIACRPSIFRYDSLFDRADFSGIPRAQEAFDRLNTTNFEAVIRALNEFVALADLYLPTRAGTSAAGLARSDAIVLRETLVRAVADCHPDRPGDIASEEYLKCRAFLRGFKSINTLNYDLLLYWALMQSELGDEDLKSDDGFRKPADDPEASYVSWDPDNSDGQTLRFLHGALHLYDTGTEMKKFTWINTQIPLIDQIRAALVKSFYPVFVSEGTSEEKVERIRHNDYLCKMYRSFTKIGGSIVVFGHSFDPCDDHIFKDRIGRHGKTTQLFVSLFGSPDSKANKEIVRRASHLSSLRPLKRPLSVHYFDANDVGVWE